MSISRLLRTPCTVTRRGTSGVDAHGNPVPVDVDTVTTVCYLSPASSSEETGDRTLATADWSLFLPAGTPVAAEDIVTVDDVAYEVVGPGRPFRRPRDTGDHHVEVSVRVQS